MWREHVVKADCLPHEPPLLQRRRTESSKDPPCSRSSIRRPAPAAAIFRAARTAAEREGEVMGRYYAHTCQPVWSAEQLWDDLAIADPRRTAEWIGKLGVRIDSQAIVDRGGKISRIDRVIPGKSTLGIRSPENVPAPDAAAGQHHRHAGDPMVPAGCAVDAGGPAHLPHPDHQRIL